MDKVGGQVCGQVGGQVGGQSEVIIDTLVGTRGCVDVDSTSVKEWDIY